MNAPAVEVPYRRFTTVRSVLAFGVVIAVAWSASAAAQQPARVELRDGDRVALVGDSFFEREYRFGLIETALTLAHPDKRLTFRNLGWSGDTVWGEARAYFGEPKEGYAELTKNVALAEPTLLLVAYGANESFGGDAKLAAFLAQYRTLLDDLRERTPRIVLLTPLPPDASTSPLPAAALEARRAAVARYAEAVRTLAKERGLATIDIFDAMSGAAGVPRRPLFENGVHLTEAGYAAAATHIAESTLSPERRTRFLETWAGFGASGEAPIDPSRQPWAPLRDLIVTKNDAFFHRWRPANVTYLYLFRQREQGNNAVEIPRFDPVVEQQEQEIARLKTTLTSGAAAPARSPR